MLERGHSARGAKEQCPNYPNRDIAQIGAVECLQAGPAPSGPGLRNSLGATPGRALHVAATERDPPRKRESMRMGGVEAGSSSVRAETTGFGRNATETGFPIGSRGSTIFAASAFHREGVCECVFSLTGNGDPERGPAHRKLVTSHCARGKFIFHLPRSSIRRILPPDGRPGGRRKQTTRTSRKQHSRNRSSEVHQLSAWHLVCQEADGRKGKHESKAIHGE